MNFDHVAIGILFKTISIVSECYNVIEIGGGTNSAINVDVNLRYIRIIHKRLILND